MGYRTVSIPDELVFEIENSVLKKKYRGYTSIAEFVKDAIRRYLDEMDSVQVFPGRGDDSNVKKEEVVEK